MRVLLADDERHRYSAWFRDYTSPANYLSQQDPETSANNAPTDQLTRSQQLLALSASQPQQTTTMSNQIPNTFPSVVDLRIALITPPSVATKPMQVRLTRRSQCADLRSYLSSASSLQPTLATGAASSSSFMASYSAPASSSAASPSSSGAAFLISQYPVLSLVLIGSLLSSLIVISYSISRSAISNCVAGSNGQRVPAPMAAQASYHSPAAAAAMTVTMGRPIY